MGEPTRKFKIGDRVKYDFRAREGTVTGIDTSQEWRQVQVEWDPIPNIEWCNPLQLLPAGSSRGESTE